VIRDHQIGRSRRRPKPIVPEDEQDQASVQISATEDVGDFTRSGDWRSAR